MSTSWAASVAGAKKRGREDSGSDSESDGGVDEMADAFGGLGHKRVQQDELGGLDDLINDMNNMALTKNDPWVTKVKDKFKLLIDDLRNDVDEAVAYGGKDGMEYEFQMDQLKLYTRVGEKMMAELKKPDPRDHALIVAVNDVTKDCHVYAFRENGKLVVETQPYGEEGDTGEVARTVISVKKNCGFYDKTVRLNDDNPAFDSDNAENSVRSIFLAIEQNDHILN